MPRISNLFIPRRLVEKLEIVVTIVWLIYFMGARVPPPLPETLINAISYPFIAFLVLLHWKRCLWVATRDIPLLLLLATALASIFWSVAPQLTLDANRGFVRIFIFGVYIAARYSIKEQIKILTWAFGIAAILSLVLALAVPSYGIAAREAHAGAFVGIFPYKNYLGYSMVLGAIVFLFSALQKRKPNWLFWGGFCLTVALTLLARSSASLVCLLVLLSLMPLYQLIKLYYKPKVIFLSFVCILGGIAAMIIFGNLETILVDLLGKSTEFNSRTPLWTLIIEKILEERPWLGYGVNAFWRSDAGWYVLTKTWASLSRENLLNQSFNFHSSYLPIFAGLGFLGLLLSAISLATVFTRVIILLFSTKQIEFFWTFQFLIFILVGGFADDIVSILNTTSYSVIYVSICLSTAIECRRIRVSQKRYVGSNPIKFARSHSSKPKVL